MFPIDDENLSFSTLQSARVARLRRRLPLLLAVSHETEKMFLMENHRGIPP